MIFHQFLSLNCYAFSLIKIQIFYNNNESKSRVADINQRHFRHNSES